MTSNKVKVVKVALRFVALMATLCAGMLMTNLGHHSVHIGYGDLTPHRCFQITNFVAFAYSIIGLFLINSKSLLWKPVVALDALLMVVLWSSCSASLAVIHLEMKGNSHAYWIPICPRVHSYCVRAIAAISVGYVGALAYLLLHLFSLQEALNALLI